MAKSVYRIRYEAYKGKKLFKELDAEIVTVEDDGINDPYDVALEKGKEILLARGAKKPKGTSVTFNGTLLRDEP